MKQIRNLLYIDCVVEWSGVTNFAFVSGYLALQALNQVTDGHTRRNGMRIDDDVRSDALAGERHVLLSAKQ